MAQNYQNLFEKLKKQETSTNEHRSFGNEYLLKLKPGNTYTFRLLWLPSADGYEREYPMINQYVHRHWDNDSSSGKRLDTVYCPTSQYLIGDGSNGWNACPICKECGNLYKKYDKDQSQSAYDMWKAYHRALVGYVPVYVVSSSDEYATGVRILTYGKQMKDFFDRKIFGVINNKKAGTDDDTPAISEDEIVGLDALMYIKDDDVATTGCNFIVSVSTKKMPIAGRQVDMPQYNMDFSRKQTTISSFIVNDDEVEITPDYLNGLSQTIKFDEDYYKESSAAELQDFYNKYLIANSVNSEDGELIMPTTESKMKTMDISNTKPILDEVANIPASKAKAKHVVEVTKNDEDESDINSSANSDIDDVDVDALIDGL